MAREDATVTVGGDASQVERAFAKAKDAWRAAASDLASSMGSAAKSVVSSFADVALSGAKINFAAQHAQVVAFEGATARMAVSTGRGLEEVRSSIESTGKAIGKRPAEVAAWAVEVGRVTHNVKAAEQAIGGMSQLASLTGRSVDDYKNLASVLGTVGKVGGDTSHAVGMIVAQAEKLGVEGGADAFAERIAGMGDQLSRFAISGEKDLLRVTGALAGLTRGYSDAAARRVDQALLGSITADTRGWSRFLGRDILDKQGHVEKPEQVLEDISGKMKKRYGTGANALRIFRQEFGDEAGSAMFYGDFKAGAAAAGLSPSDKARTAAERLSATDYGKRQTADATLDVSSRELMGSSTKLGEAADKLKEFAANNPFTSTMAANVAGAAGGTLLGRAGSLVKGAVQGGSKGAIAIGEGLAGVGALASGALVAGAGYLGYKGGQALGGYLLDREENARYKEESAPIDVETARLKEIRDRKRAERGDAPIMQPAELKNAIKDGMKEVKFQIVTTSDNPVDIVNQANQSVASGNQSGG